MFFTPIWILGVMEIDRMPGYHVQTTQNVFWMHATGEIHTYSKMKVLELCGGGYGG